MAPRFYLLHGPDEFAISEFVDGLKDKLGDPAMASLNTTLLDGRTVTLSVVRAAAEAMPFLARRRLVIVEGWLTRLLKSGPSPAADSGTDESEGEDEEGGAAAAPTEKRSGAKEVLLELVAYLPTLPETTALVFVEQREIPPRNPLLKAAAEADWAFVRLFDLPKGDALARWIRNRAKAEGGEFTREAAQALAEVDDDPRSLRNEITKLLTYVNFERPVELDDVQTLTPAGGEAKIFDLVDAIGQRRAPQAMRELHKLLETDQPLYVLGMIVRQYRLMLQAREMLDAHATEAEISRALSLHPFPTGKVCAQARAFDVAALERIYRRLLDYDADIKTGQMEPTAALTVLVGALTS